MGGGTDESKKPKNWTKKSGSELKKMTPQQRAKYDFFTDVAALSCVIILNT